jgi:hypothetical protein
MKTDAEKKIAAYMRKGWPKAVTVAQKQRLVARGLARFLMIVVQRDGLKHKDPAVRALVTFLLGDGMRHLRSRSEREWYKFMLGVMQSQHIWPSTAAYAAMYLESPVSSPTLDALDELLRENEDRVAKKKTTKVPRTRRR